MPRTAAVDQVLEEKTAAEAAALDLKTPEERPQSSGSEDMSKTDEEHTLFLIATVKVPPPPPGTPPSSGGLRPAPPEAWDMECGLGNGAAVPPAPPPAPAPAPLFR